MLRIIARLNLGGPARHVTTLDAGLRARGYETLLVYGSVGTDEGSLESLVDEQHLPAVKVPALGRRLNPISDLRAFLKLVALTYRTRPDIVHTHTAKGGTLGRLAAATYNLTRAGRQRCLVVHTFHGHVFAGYFGTVGSALARLVERMLVLCATDRVITISSLQKRDIVERFHVAPARKVSIVPLGLDLDDYLHLPPRDVEAGRAHGLEPDDVVFGFAGRFVPIKDLGTLLRALSLVAGRGLRVKLVMAGDGGLRKSLQAEAIRLGVADKVRFMGWCERPLDVLKLVDVAVLSSINEGTPLWLIEAMAAARAVAATAAGGVPDIVDDGRTGLLVPVGDAEALADAMSRLATDVDARRHMGARARECAAARFGSARLIDDMDRLYRLALAERRGDPRVQADEHSLIS